MLDKHCRVYKGGVCNPFSILQWLFYLHRILYLLQEYQQHYLVLILIFSRAKNNSEARKFLYFSSVSNKNTTLNVTILLQNVLKC